MVERSNRSIRIFADWCNGSTPDSDSGDESSNLLSAVKKYKNGGKNNVAIMWPAARRKNKIEYFCTRGETGKRIRFKL